MNFEKFLKRLKPKSVYALGYYNERGELRGVNWSSNFMKLPSSLEGATLIKIVPVGNKRHPYGKRSPGIECGDSK